MFSQRIFSRYVTPHTRGRGRRKRPHPSSTPPPPLLGSWFSLYSSGTSSNKSDTETLRAFASRSSVVVFTPLKGSLHILLIVKKDTSEALDKLDILNPLDSAISFTLRRIILLPFGSMVCQL